MSAEGKNYYRPQYWQDPTYPTARSIELQQRALVEQVQAVMQLQAAFRAALEKDRATDALRRALKNADQPPLDGPAKSDDEILRDLGIEP